MFQASGAIVCDALDAISAPGVPLLSESMATWNWLFGDAETGDATNADIEVIVAFCPAI